MASAVYNLPESLPLLPSTLQGLYLATAAALLTFPPVKISIVPCHAPAIRPVPYRTTLGTVLHDFLLGLSHKTYFGACDFDTCGLSYPSLASTCLPIARKAAHSAGSKLIRGALQLSCRWLLFQRINDRAFGGGSGGCNTTNTPFSRCTSCCEAPDYDGDVPL
ncbi:hypothetical protein DFH06DRAFT_1253525 [Mycena polygramma]|nr:hypothetical protein DFH06DRAFT_1253525 [Mycena polygramma]